MTVITAERGDRPALSALWRECFGDTAAEQDCFWNTAGKTAQAFFVRENGAPQAMLCALPVDYIGGDGEVIRTAYIYAVCTRQSARGRGLCTQLLVQAEQILRTQGFAACVLVPADASLARFYEMRGYRAAFFRNRTEIGRQAVRADVRRIGAADYRALREMLLTADFAAFSEDFLRCAQGYGELSGAGLYRIETADALCCAAAMLVDGALHISELIPDSPAAAAALTAALGIQEGTVSSPGGGVPQAWGKPLRGALPTGYWGLSL